MSISSRITQIEQHIGNAYDKIEDLGIDLTDVDKNIDNISSMLENVWDEYPKVTATNVEEASINGTKKGRMEIDLKGQTEQDNTLSPNLYNVNDAVLEQNVTLIDNDYLSINVDNSLGTNAIYAQYFTNNLDLKPSTQYTIVAEILEVSGNGTLNIINKNGNQGQFTQNYSYNLSNLQNNQKIIFKATTVDSFENITRGLRTLAYFTAGQSGLIKFRISVLEDLTITESNFYYAKYGEELPPSPYFPSPIKNVTGNANVKIQNKNLFDGEIELGSINPANGELQPSTVRTRSKNFIKVKPNTTYTISVQTGQYRWIVGYNAKKIGITDGNVSGQASALSVFLVSIYSTTNTFTTTATTEYIKWYDTNSTDLAEKVQIEQGTTATSYVPHQEQNLPFSLKSKNLFDKDTIYQANKLIQNTGAITNTQNFDLYKANVNANKPYTLSIENTSSTNRDCRICAFDSTDTFISEITSFNINANTKASTTFTTPNNTSYILYHILKTNNEVQLEEGSTATSYEPYYDIRAMQGTTLEDDGINNVRTQLIIDGTENITLSTATVGTSNYGKFDITISKRANANDRTALCSHLKYKFQGWATAGNENTFSFTVPTILRLLLDINEFPTVEALKTYLANNNMTFEFVTEQPEIIPYNATQQAQYNAIKQARSYDDITYISSESDELGFNMDVESLRKMDN